jgi:hypothetical protein
VGAATPAPVIPMGESAPTDGAPSTAPAAGPVPQTAPIRTGPAEGSGPAGPGEPPRRGRGWLYAGITAVAVALAATAATTPPTTPATTRPSALSSTPTSQSFPPASATASTLPLTKAVPSRYFSMRVPGNWVGHVDKATPDVGDRCVPAQAFFDTHLTDPSVTEFGVIVDVTPDFAGDVSSRIHCQAAHQGGSVVSTTFHGLPAFQWTRAVGTSHGVDIQFEEGPTLFALYLFAPADGFAEDVPTLNAIAESFLPAPPFVP